MSDSDEGPGLFKDVLFYIHRSLRKEKDSLETLITRHGGIISEKRDECNTVLVDYESSAFDRLTRKYDFYRDVWVEPPHFLHNCIAKKTFEHVLPPKKAMGGAPPGKRGVKFTRQDDAFLAEWIYLRVPDADEGGNVGRRIFQDLERPEVRKKYKLAARHPWSAWRNRYARNGTPHRQMIDRMIDEMSTTNPRDPQRKGELQFSRLARRRMQAMRVGSGSEEEEEVDELDDEEEVGEGGREEEPQGGEGEENEIEPEAEIGRGASPVDERNNNDGSGDNLDFGAMGEDDGLNDFGADYQADMDYMDVNVEADKAAPLRHQSTSGKEESGRYLDHTSTLPSSSFPPDTQATLVNPPTQPSRNKDATASSSRNTRGKRDSSDESGEGEEVTRKTFKNPIVEIPVMKKRRRDPVMPPAPRSASPDPPYRNTRARSRSVEPQAPPSGPRRKPARSARKSILSVVQESGKEGHDEDAGGPNEDLEEPNEDLEEESHADDGDIPVDDASVAAVEAALGFSREAEIESHRRSSEDRLSIDIEASEALAREAALEESPVDLDEVQGPETDIQSDVVEEAQQEEVKEEDEDEEEDEAEEGEDDEEEEEEEEEGDDDDMRFFYELARERQNIRTADTSRIRSTSGPSPVVSQVASPTPGAQRSHSRPRQSLQNVSRIAIESEESDFPPESTRAREESERIRREQASQPYTPPPGTRAEQVVRRSARLKA